MKIYLSVITLFLFTSVQSADAIEKAVKLYIPACTSSLVNAVVVGILEDVPGVRHARVNGMDSAATVFFDNATTSIAEMRKALGKANIAVDGEPVPLDAQGRNSVRQ